MSEEEFIVQESGATPARFVRLHARNASAAAAIAAEPSTPGPASSRCGPPTTTPNATVPSPTMRSACPAPDPHRNDRTIDASRGQAVAWESLVNESAPARFQERRTNPISDSGPKPITFRR